MEDNETVNPDYLKGFNEGYLISKEMPELAQQLSNINSQAERIVGMKDGHEQYTKEQIDRTPKWLREDRLTSIEEKEKEMDKDKDDLEKE
jgi:hypothetical protein